MVSSRRKELATFYNGILDTELYKNKVCVCKRERKKKPECMCGVSTYVCMQKLEEDFCVLCSIPLPPFEIGPFTEPGASLTGSKPQQFSCFYPEQCWGTGLHDCMDFHMDLNLAPYSCEASALTQGHLCGLSTTMSPSTSLDLFLFLM